MRGGKEWIVRAEERITTRDDSRSEVVSDSSPYLFVPEEQCVREGR